MKDQKTNWLALSSSGFQLAGSLLLFGWIGSLIDKNFSIGPIGLVVGLVIGGIASLFQIWKMTSNR
jgi:F0F1-type ATP synthase assembly protein I